MPTSATWIAAGPQHPISPNLPQFTPLPHSALLQTLIRNVTKYVRRLSATPILWVLILRDSHLLLEIMGIPPEESFCTIKAISLSLPLVTPLMQ